MSKNTAFQYDDLDEFIESLIEFREDKKNIYLTAKYASIEEDKDNKTNVSLIALEKLVGIGFDKNIGTLLFAGLIEDLYYERSIFDSSDYFDLSKPDNPHYKNLLDKVKIGDEDKFKKLIMISIGTSKCESKNINDIAYSITNEICKELGKKDFYKKRKRKELN